MVGEMGLTVVLAIGSIRLNLRSIPHFEWDLGIHKSVGLDPARAALVFVRSPSHFRASYAPIAARIFLADTPGPTGLNMRRLAFTKVTRPLYPLDLGERLDGGDAPRFLRRQLFAEILRSWRSAGSDTLAAACSGAATASRARLSRASHQAAW